MVMARVHSQPYKYLEKTINGLTNRMNPPTIAVIRHEPVLLGVTIKRNILFGNPYDE